jgi:hypothetical protein
MLSHQRRRLVRDKGCREKSGAWNGLERGLKGPPGVWLSAKDAASQFWAINRIPFLAIAPQTPENSFSELSSFFRLLNRVLCILHSRATFGTSMEIISPMVQHVILLMRRHSKLRKSHLTISTGLQVVIFFSLGCPIHLRSLAP